MNHLRKRTLSAFLCLGMLLGTLSLFSCNGNQAIPPGSSEPQSGAPAQTPSEERGTGDMSACKHVFDQSDPCEMRVCSLCNLHLKPAHVYLLSEDESDLATLSTVGEEVYRCAHCEQKRTVMVGKVDPETLGLPILYLTGSTEEMTKEQTVTLQASYRSEETNFDCAATFKWQGNTSLKYDKKNYSVKFYNDDTLEKKFKVDLGWGKENKYCLKANYVDSSQARNIVGARLFAEIVRARKNAPEQLTGLTTCGVIDGYPILIYLNGSFHGLYTLNIPKDKWMMGMEGGEEAREAIVMGDQWSESCSMRELMASDFSNGWELEHCSTEDSAWVVESFNELISFVMRSSDAEFRQGISRYLDVEAAIDVLIYIYVIRAGDNGAKNLLWATFDGTHWIPSMYDMDGTFGIRWNGDPWDDNGAQMMPSENNGVVTVQDNYSELWNRLFATFRPEIKARYAQLRETVLSEAHIRYAFSEFMSQIPDVAYASDLEKWPDMPHPEANDLAMINNYMMRRISIVDAFINRL